MWLGARRYAEYRIISTVTVRSDYPMLYLPREDGQGLVEYALILVLVAIVVMALVGIIGGGIGNIFSNIVNTL